MRALASITSRGGEGGGGGGGGHRLLWDGLQLPEHQRRRPRQRRFLAARGLPRRGGCRGPTATATAAATAATSAATPAATATAVAATTAAADQLRPCVGKRLQRLQKTPAHVVRVEARPCAQCGRPRGVADGEGEVAHLAGGRGRRRRLPQPGQAGGRPAVLSQGARQARQYMRTAALLAFFLFPRTRLLRRGGGDGDVRHLHFYHPIIRAELEAVADEVEEHALQRAVGQRHLGHVGAVRVEQLDRVPFRAPLVHHVGGLQRVLDRRGQMHGLELGRHEFAHLTRQRGACV